MTTMTRLLRLDEVIHRTGLSRSTIYAMMSSGSMPEPVRISRGTVGWIEAEIEDFLLDRIAQSRAKATRLGGLQNASRRV